MHGLSGLSAIRAATARDGLEALYLVAYCLVEGGIGQEDQPVVAGVGVGILASFAWAEYARLSDVHSDLQVFVGRVPGSGDSCGISSLSDICIVHYRLDFVYISSKIIYKLANEDRRRRMLTVVKIDGDKVRAAREERFFSQRELAEKAGINHNTVWRIEGAGPAEVHPRTIRKIATALGVDPASLTPRE